MRFDEALGNFYQSGNGATFSSSRASLYVVHASALLP